MEALTDSIYLWRHCLGFGVINIIDSEIQLIINFSSLDKFLVAVKRIAYPLMILKALDTFPSSSDKSRSPVLCLMIGSIACRIESHLFYLRFNSFIKTSNSLLLNIHLAYPSHKNIMIGTSLRARQVKSFLHQKIHHKIYLQPVTKGHQVDKNPSNTSEQFPAQNLLAV